MFSDKITTLEYDFIGSFEINHICWCMFVVYTSLNGVIQGIVSIIELLFFIAFYIDKITTLKWPECPLLKWPVDSATFSVHKIWPSPSLKINKMNLLEIIRPMIMVISNNFKTQQMCSEAVEKDPTLLAFYPCMSQDEKKETGKLWK